MNAIGLGGALKAALLAALLAALVATAWHAVATEPIIDRAIELEEARHGGEHEDEPIVGRGAQRVGLGLALLLYGLSWAFAVGAVFALAQDRLPGATLGRRAALLALAAAWALALLPALTYPANPPGVGDPETIGLRQGLYVVVLVLGVLGTMAAIALGQRLRGRLGSSAWPVTLVAYAAYCAALYATLPPNPDPTPIPADLLAAFRLRSVLGLLIYWGVFAAAFGFLIDRRASRAAGSHRPRTLPEAGQA